MNAAVIVAMLSSLCTSEIDFHPTATDCPAIYTVIDRRAEAAGTTWEAMARRYSGRVYNRRRTDRRRWIAWLSPSMHGAPRGWSMVHPWPASRWKDRVGESAMIVAGRVRHTCTNGEPDHWGSPRFDRERIRRGIARGYWRVLRCPGTRNTMLALRAARAGGV